MAKKGSVEVGPPAKEGETRIRRSYVSPDELTTEPAPGVRTFYDILQYTEKQYGDKPAVGWRDTIKVHEEKKDVTKTVGGKQTTETKTWQFYELSDYHYMSYKDFAQNVRWVASGLVELGHSPKTIANIYATTSHKWFMFAHACAAHSITFATAYDSLGESGLEHSIKEPDVYSLFTNANLLGTIAGVVDKTPTLKVVIYDGPESEIKPGAIDKIKQAQDGGITIMTLDELIKLGKEHPHEVTEPPKADTLATIMYTSGTTGAPKGVLITHGNIVSCVAGVTKLLSNVVRSGEKYIAYLPLAHIFEFAAEMSFFYVGVPMGYATVKTLTDTNMRNCLGDMRAFKPTVMVGVPAVWELIRKGILAKVRAGGAVKSGVFHGALAAKKLAAKYPLPFVSSLTDVVVFNTVRQATGGSLRWALSGGAAISRDTQEFLTTALVTCLQGYGMTESCAMCAILPPDFMSFGPVGVPSPAIEIKLVDVAEAGYHATNDPPQGEVWIRGPAVTQGYYKREEVTRETMAEEGWLKTGDVGQWNKDGTLSIIDRMKNLVKLAGGEYIALERLEATYKSNPYIANICVVASTDANRPMAVCIANEAHLRNLVTDRGLGDSKEELDMLCAKDKVKDAVLKELNATGKKNGFKPLEMLQTIVLTADEWTPQSGLVTAAQKLQRKAIEKHYASEIKKVYP